MTDHWYYIKDGQSVGPVPRRELIAALIRSPFWHQEQVWKPEYTGWREAGSVEELSTELTQVHLQQLAQHHRGGAPKPSLRTKVLVYAGLALLGIVSAVVYWLVF
jgi:hypothetical protein